MKIKKLVLKFYLIRDTYPLLPPTKTQKSERERVRERDQYSNYNDLSPIT